MKLHTKIEHWAHKAPFRITGYTFVHVDVLLVTLALDGHVGRGEAAGVYYKNDTPTSMQMQIEALRSGIESGITRDSLQDLLPPCGARNALDCALWDLDAKRSGRPVWQMAGLARPLPLVTTLTCGADEPVEMAKAAGGVGDAQAMDEARVLAVRDARPDVWLGVDGNQGFTRASLEKLLPTLVQNRVSLIEQPFPVGRDAWFSDLTCGIPIAADESVQSLGDIEPLVGRVQVINIKLDKCGGLTEGLKLAKTARALGLDCMVGNMMGTSLAMAPAYVLGQLCGIVDLDGPTGLTKDRENPVDYTRGHITCPEALWGYP